MKTVIAALNSKYIHSALAPWCLKSYCGDDCGEIRIREFTINESLESILATVYHEKAQVVAFSCHIWDIGQTLRLCSDLKMISPETVIVLGGPEVSFDAPSIMEENTAVDFVICGEGERPFKQLLKTILKGMPTEGSGCLENIAGLEYINGIVFRKNGCVISNESCVPPENLDMLPSPYSADMLESLGNRILYYESSRGCPFSCSYCLSSTTKGVRYLSLDRVKADIDMFHNYGVKQVKFVDRTFNCNKKRAMAVFRHIIDSFGEGINFHFEVAADLFDDEMIELLSRANPGLIQLEIGIQSFNEKTLEAVDRKTDSMLLYKNVSRLLKAGNIHIHLDLIAGLPYEDFQSFGQSFDRVYSLCPHQLQLGFLKLLKGSRIRREADKHGYLFRDYPPYEVLRNHYLAYDEMTVLKGIEDLVDKYHNSGRFVRTLEYVTDMMAPFDFYLGLYRYCSENRIMEAPVPARELYGILYKYIKTLINESEDIKDLLKLDFLASDISGHLPESLKSDLPGDFKKSCHEFLHDISNITEYLPRFEGIPASQILKKIHIEPFSPYFYSMADGLESTCEGPLYFLFNYDIRDRVTGLYNYTFLKKFP